MNADQVRGSADATDRLCVDVWLRKVRSPGIDEEDLPQAFDRMRHDRLADLEAQLGWLRKAGFADVDCWYKWLNFAVYSGRRLT